MTQEYVGTKIVTAWEAESKDGQPGYSVKYADGYISWSPKKAFEEAYLPLGNISHRAPHEQRVIAEAEQLADRLRKLEGFMATPAFSKVTWVDQVFLRQQLQPMTDYLAALNGRIAAFE